MSGSSTSTKVKPRKKSVTKKTPVKKASTKKAKKTTKKTTRTIKRAAKKIQPTQTAKRNPLGHLLMEKMFREGGFRGGISSKKELLDAFSTDESIFSI